MYSSVLLPDGESIHPRAKNSAFDSICDLPESDIKLPKCSCVLNCFSECTGVFVLDAEMNH